jgi:oxygen-independent coproporphyrinogen-3 oxidase
VSAPHKADSENLQSLAFDARLPTPFPRLPPLALYIHIPWCVRKCPYCDFNSHAPDGALPETDYVRALLRDLDADLAYVAGRPVTSIFFGGGTPSLFSPEAIAGILRGVEQRVALAPDAEITLEANPGTVDESRFAGFAAAGVNRLSIGVQSFADKHLAALGRIHSGDEAQRAVAAARAAGFDNFNLDLMHGLPGQTVAEAEDDLRRAIALAPTHMSWYQLTVEPNTEFFKRPPNLPVDELLADIQDAGEHLLAAAGYRQYEVSAYARPGREARHNRNYWEFGDFLGIGAGAHGKVTTADGIYRYWKTRMPGAYLKAERPLAGTCSLGADELPLEFMMNALRLIDGVDAGLFAARTGLPRAQIAPALATLVERGLLQARDDRLVATALGMRFLNDLLQVF